jgi:endonuclease YncB( thermonuclease family)
MKGQKVVRPERRGLVWATVIFSVLVLGGFGWMSQVGGGDVYERGQRAVRSWFNEPDPWEKTRDTLSYEDRVTSGHAKNGALVGVPRLLSGDTLDINGTRFRLWGVRAVPGVQFCGDASSQYKLGCGTRTEQAIPALTRGRMVACYERGKSVYGERLGQCFYMNLDLSAMMAEHGLARAEPNEVRQYTLRESFARSRRVGIWAQ